MYQIMCVLRFCWGVLETSNLKETQLLEISDFSELHTRSLDLQTPV